jgi:hypothetical protein
MPFHALPLGAFLESFLSPQIPVRKKNRLVKNRLVTKKIKTSRFGFDFFQFGTEKRKKNGVFLALASLH